MNEKAMTLLRQHAVVTLHRDCKDGVTTDTHKLYLTPGAFVEAHCKSYTRDGWSVFSVELCSHEDYLNYKINDVVDAYNDTCKERKNIRDQFKSGKLDFETYMTARAVTNELLESDLRRLYRLMNRLAREGFDCRNEEAHGLYNMEF